MLTELSDYGPYNLCSYLHPAALEKALDWISVFGPGRGINPWNRTTFFNPDHPTGIDNCLHRLPEKEDADTVCLAWHPQKIPASVGSFAQLCFALSAQDDIPPLTRDPAIPNLKVRVSYEKAAGYDVWAAFDEAVWQVIEDEGPTSDLLLKIDRDLRSYWEGRTNRPMRRQLLDVFQGRDGSTVQINQPQGGGVWIVGSRRQQLGGYQLADHNTDTAQQAFGHILGLCLLLKHCRMRLASRLGHDLELPYPCG